ncbi:hypothetical protein ACFVFQ_11280 [Streptomyces sp. NPDC057743]|uniref:hypothetical protein n=1 Tax=Streptomyces sp. NPDC057743 TaxID=3346236 RepID=UPI0036B42FFA
MSSKYAHLQRRCQAVLDSALHELPLPRPFSLETFCTQLAERRKRPLHLHPLPLQAAQDICGLWLATDTDDHIFFEQRTSRVHREHIVLHEIGHMLFDHHCAAPDGVDTRRVLPDLSPRLVQRLLGRTSYTSRQEREAEMFASLMRIRVARLNTGEPEGVLGRLEAAIGTPAGHDS